MVTITPGIQIGGLTPKWYWNAKSGRIWKCTCECGGFCYIQENALAKQLVTHCGYKKCIRPDPLNFNIPEDDD